MRRKDAAEEGQQPVRLRVAESVQEHCIFTTSQNDEWPSYSNAFHARPAQLPGAAKGDKPEPLFRNRNQERSENEPRRVCGRSKVAEVKYEKRNPSPTPRMGRARCPSPQN